VLIPTLNPGPEIGQTLSAVFGQQPSPPAEVIVVDSGSSEADIELMRGFPIRLIRIGPGQFGHGRTRNQLAREARGQVLVYLTQDARPASDAWLARLLSPLREEGVAGVYSRQIPRPDADPLIRFFLRETYPDRPARRRPNAIPASNDDQPGLARPHLSDIFFSNVGSAIRREVWERVPFREDVVMSEDQHWAAAALRGGWELAYEPSACVVHSHGYSLGGVFRRNVLSGASLRGLIADSRGGIARQGLSYVVREALYLCRVGALGWLPYMVAYETLKVAGFALGQRRPARAA